MLQKIKNLFKMLFLQKPKYFPMDRIYVPSNNLVFTVVASYYDMNLNLITLVSDAKGNRYTLSHEDINGYELYYDFSGGMEFGE